MDLNKLFGANLQWVRERLGFTGAELAAILGISESKLNKLENGKLTVSLPFITEVAMTLNVHLRHFVYRGDDLMEFEAF